MTEGLQGRPYVVVLEEVGKILKRGNRDKERGKNWDDWDGWNSKFESKFGVEPRSGDILVAPGFNRGEMECREAIVRGSILKTDDRIVSDGRKGSSKLRVKKKKTGKLRKAA